MGGYWAPQRPARYLIRGFLPANRDKATKSSRPFLFPRRRPSLVERHQHYNHHGQQSDQLQHSNERAVVAHLRRGKLRHPSARRTSRVVALLPDLSIVAIHDQPDFLAGGRERPLSVPRHT